MASLPFFDYSIYASYLDAINLGYVKPEGTLIALKESEISPG